MALFPVSAASSCLRTPRSLRTPLSTSRNPDGGHATPSMSARSRSRSLMLLYFMQPESACYGVSANSRVLVQPQTMQSFHERPVARDYLCDVMCCHEPPSSQFGTTPKLTGRSFVSVRGKLIWGQQSVGRPNHLMGSCAIELLLFIQKNLGWIDTWPWV